MKRGYYFKFAVGSIKKNKQIYFPYILTGIIATAMFYIVYSMSVSDAINNMKGGGTVTSMLGFGVYVMIFLSAILLFFSNNFLMKRRKSEFGLYNVLGMEKRHIFRIILIENIITASVGTIAGILTGIIFNKAVCLLLVRMLKESASIKLAVSVQSVTTTVLVFLAIYFVVLLNGIRQIGFSNTIDLVRGSQVGEKEPKNKWILALLGAVMLALGYWLSLSIEDPVQAVAVFFVAVMLVIAATYLLFTAGSIMLLKILKKNNKYYYKTNHFISVSGMMYRMKQNATSLASICILSTMVLVTISATTTLYTASSDTVYRMHPSELELTVYSYDGNTYAEEKLKGLLNSIIDKYEERAGEKLYQESDVKDLTYIPVAAGINGNEIDVSENYNNTNLFTEISVLCIIEKQEYERFTGKTYELAENEIIVYDDNGELSSDNLVIAGKTYNVKEYIKDLGNEDIDDVLSTYDVSGVRRIVVLLNDQSELRNIYDVICRESGYVPGIQTYYGVDISSEYSEEISDEYKSEFGEFCENDPEFENIQFGSSIDTRSGTLEDYNALYGGLYFVGIFLSIVFMLATILIIYYKQISEGYSDRRRYEIMQKVGLTRQEIKKSIHSQIITVFFLPLITAGIHTAFAVPMINRVLTLFGMANTPLFVASVAGSFILFAVLYIIVYMITSKTYYKIVSTKEQ